MNFAEALRQVSGPLSEPVAERPVLRLVEAGSSHAVVDPPAPNAPAASHVVRLELSLSP